MVDALRTRERPPADPYAKQVLYRIGRDYGYGLEHPEERFEGPMNRIKIVNRATRETDADAVRETYRFLPSAHTDFIFDGLDSKAVEEMFAS